MTETSLWSHYHLRFFSQFWVLLGRGVWAFYLGHKTSGTSNYNAWLKRAQSLTFPNFGVLHEVTKLLIRKQKQTSYVHQETNKQILNKEYLGLKSNSPIPAVI